MMSTAGTTKRVTYETCDVFTTQCFGGNPLAVVFDAEHLSDATLQKIAAEFNYSEITFVLPPSDPQNTARVRIFTPVTEYPFAGHPNVGTAAVLAQRGPMCFGKPLGSTLRFEEGAGVVPLDLIFDEESHEPVGAMLTAPEPWRIEQPEMPVADVAACLGLDASDVCAANHKPLVATAGLPFGIVELSSYDALQRSRGQPSVCAKLEHEPWWPPRGRFHAYVRPDAANDADGADIRCRMHRQNGTEDAGTGSANCALLGLLASLAPSPGTLQARIVQGVEMGRPSLLQGEATTDADGVVRSVRIGGRCVSVSRGEFVSLSSHK